MKLNCWEFKKCGRGPGGSKVSELGICIAASNAKMDKSNNGKNGGRSCWVIAGTLCGGKVQGSYALKTQNCRICEFFTLVQSEENATGTYESPSELMKKLHDKST